jgi:hypothetical protein
MSSVDKDTLGMNRRERSSESDIAQLLRRAGTSDSAPVPDVLTGFQRKLRERSGGKFYADEWSTAKQPPIATYLVTSAIMLAVVTVMYALLSPLVGNPEPVRNEPAPVRVIPPRVTPPSGQ